MFIWLLVGYMWFFLVRPWDWEMFAGLPGTAPVYLTSAVVCLIVVWTFSQFSNPDVSDRRPLGNIFTLALLLYVSAVTVSALFSPYQAFLNSNFQVWILCIVPVYVILVTGVRTEKDLKIFVTGFTLAFAFNVCLAYWGYLMTGNVRQIVGAEGIVGTGRGGTNANAFAGIIVSALPLVIALIALCKKYWHYLFALGYILVSVRVATMTGSRTGLFMLLALAVTPVLFSRYRFRLLPVLLLMPIFWFAMPEDMQNRYRTIWDPDINKTANYTVDHRVFLFYDVLKYWQQYPVFGIGPDAYLDAEGTGVPAHSIPTKLAGELGTVGVVTFLFLLSCFGINHYNVWKNYKYLKEKNLGKEGLYCWRVSLAVMYAVLVMLVRGIAGGEVLGFFWTWLGAFQVLAAMFMQEKVTAAMQGKLLPSLPMRM